MFIKITCLHSQGVLPSTPLFLLALQVDDYNDPVDGENAGSLRPTRPALRRQVTTLKIKGHHQAATSRHGGNQEVRGNEERREEERSATPFGPTSCQTKGIQHQPNPQTQLLPQPYGHSPRPTQPPPKPSSHLQVRYSTSLTVPYNQAISLPEVCVCVCVNSISLLYSHQHVR